MPDKEEQQDFSETNFATLGKKQTDKQRKITKITTVQE